MHAYIHTYIHTYMHTYIHTYIHTYTHSLNSIYVYIYICTHRNGVVLVVLFKLLRFIQLICVNLAISMLVCVLLYIHIYVIYTCMYVLATSFFAICSNTSYIRWQTVRLKGHLLYETTCLAASAFMAVGIRSFHCRGAANAVSTTRQSQAKTSH